MECTIYLAEGCNLKCTYCYEGIDKKTGKMDIRTFDQTLAFIMKNRVENDKIHIVFLGGEPLLNKPLFFYAINKIMLILYLIFDYPHKHYTFKYFEV